MKNNIDAKRIELSVIKHKTPKHIICDWLNIDSKTDSDTIIKMDPFSKKKTGTIAEAVEILNKVGRWGFCRHSINSKPSEIHFWALKDCHIANITNIFAHEMAHLAGYKKEQDAVTIGEIASFAMILSKRYYKNKIKF